MGMLSHSQSIDKQRAKLVLQHGLNWMIRPIIDTIKRWKEYVSGGKNMECPQNERVQVQFPRSIVLFLRHLWSNAIIQAGFLSFQRTENELQGSPGFLSHDNIFWTPVRKIRKEMRPVGVQLWRFYTWAFGESPSVGIKVHFSSKTANERAGLHEKSPLNEALFSSPQCHSQSLQLWMKTCSWHISVIALWFVSGVQFDHHCRGDV